MIYVSRCPSTRFRCRNLACKQLPLVVPRDVGMSARLSHVIRQNGIGDRGRMGICILQLSKAAIEPPASRINMLSNPVAGVSGQHFPGTASKAQFEIA